MKARVKATGEIVEIHRFVDTEQNEWIDCYLEFLEPIVPDYWTRLEHQYAGMVMQGMLSNEYTHKLYLDNKNYPIGLLNDSIKIAHALVGKMKEKEERE